MRATLIAFRLTRTRTQAHQKNAPGRMGITPWKPAPHLEFGDMREKKFARSGACVVHAGRVARATTILKWYEFSLTKNGGDTLGQNCSADRSNSGFTRCVLWFLFCSRSCHRIHHRIQNRPHHAAFDIIVIEDHHDGVQVTGSIRHVASD